MGTVESSAGNNVRYRIAVIFVVAGSCYCVITLAVLMKAMEGACATFCFRPHGFLSTLGYVVSHADVVFVIIDR